MHTIFVIRGYILPVTDLECQECSDAQNIFNISIKSCNALRPRYTNHEVMRGTISCQHFKNILEHSSMAVSGALQSFGSFASIHNLPSSFSPYSKSSNSTLSYR